MFLNGNPFAKIESGNVYYYHNDHLGTPQKMTDSSGSTVWYGEFLPFGEPLSITGTITSNLRFPGQYYDEETGLHYNCFRDYKPMIGRYVEADPVGIKRGANHLYVYVNNNPIRFRDPLGLIATPRKPGGDCIKCDFSAILECIGGIKYDPFQGMACARCIFEHDPASCAECAPVGDVLDCIKKNCHSGKWNKCGECE